MHTQHRPITEDCPVCGCQVKIQLQGGGHAAVCEICRQRFTVLATDDGQVALVTCPGDDWSLQAEQRVGPSTATMKVGRRTDPQWHIDVAGRTWVYPPDCGDDQLTSDYAPKEPSISHWGAPVLVVEHRDEVFARIAADLAAAGFCVVRAETASAAIRICVVYQPEFVIANRDMPDHSGWLMAAKLRFVDPTIRLWLYQPQLIREDQGLAQFLRIEEVLIYGSNLFRLAEMILSRFLPRYIPTAVVQEPVAA